MVSNIVFLALNSALFFKFAILSTSLYGSYGVLGGYDAVPDIRKVIGTAIFGLVIFLLFSNQAQLLLKVGRKEEMEKPTQLIISILIIMFGLVSLIAINSLVQSDISQYG